ncbi:uncharacterized protein LOC100193603 [Zea mays]|uniref:Mitochondrial substrate carrier family protein n=3 Tax=Zea mays TaxID=4577 RepID=B4FFM7_MAIZE|nr:uncharacterized protein LOC100193603 [Zea mays]ACF80920.1 unknown [Zea mays]AQK40337.1 Mitochondrial substrate carrier family protein [Zea mays]AQK40341.1 Mitochondrial substrate carrier family protein [Zea mays]|eukprot:NP_001132178.1 uncharacterized protein LOC100193603 [Zea mays]
MQPRYGEARQPLPGRYALYHFGTSGAAVAAATAVTHPFDVIKVRLQMQLAGQRGNLVGMGTIFTQMVEREGARSLYLGLAPALARAVVYGGLRFGLYEPCKHVCSYAFGSTNFAFKFASGVIAGGLATALTNPMEVLKVRLQMSKSSTSTIREMRKVIAHEGFKALWKGVGPAMTRAGCLTASQMATYDEAKQALMKWTPLEEGFQLHLMYSEFSISLL